jgi:alpha-galactosidase
MKIVIIGAGSASFGPAMVRDVLVCPELRGQGVELCLVDVDEASLARSLAFARELGERVGSDAQVVATADRREALPGADYVILSVCRQRGPLWEQDFRVPLSHGFRHCLGENGGPGAVFHALRSLELVLPICRDVERLAPGALLLNFTNPEMRVLHAILTLTRVRAAGLCHGIGGAIALIARLLEREAPSFRVTSAGMNHFYAVLKVEDLETGEDLLPAAKRTALAKSAGPPLFRTILEAFDTFTFPSEDHIGEYLSFGAEFAGTRWPYGQESRPVPLQPPPPRRDLLDQLRGPEPPESLFRPGGELCVPIICDIELDRGAFREAVNVLNTGPLIANLPGSAAVEVPATVDARGIHPVPVGSLPEPFAELIRRQCTICELVTEGYRTRTRKPLLQALLLDPCVNSSVEAGRLLDEMLLLQREYLPQLAG